MLETTGGEKRLLLFENKYSEADTTGAVLSKSDVTEKVQKVKDLLDQVFATATEVREYTWFGGRARLTSCC